jgi:hypothetical protein
MRPAIFEEFKDVSRSSLVEDDNIIAPLSSEMIFDR